MSKIYILNSLNNIVNSQKRKKKKVIFYYSKSLLHILKKLMLDRYINRLVVKKNNITVYLKYVFNIPIIKNIKFLSKPGRKIYMKYKNIKNIMSKNFFVSTNKGILNKKDIYEKKIGGEVLFILNV
ncbi:30S ribosomal protein S8 [Candidatus Vidania fulgoroideorum]